VEILTKNILSRPCGTHAEFFRSLFSRATTSMSFPLTNQTVAPLEVEGPAVVFHTLPMLRTPALTIAPAMRPRMTSANLAIA
jgi:hypothetical protein